jgi:hypothetical protein
MTRAQGVAMTQPIAVPLTHRGVLEVGGADARDFLQGITSNDVHQIGDEHTIWTGFLTPQGKFQHEFFAAKSPADTLWLDCEAERRDHLLKRLKVFKLRADVHLTERDDLAVYALLGVRALGALDLPALEGYTRAFGGGVAFVEPRLGTLGGRAVLPADSAPKALESAGFAFGDLADYDAARMELGIPDGSRDLEPERATLMESGFDELHGISWDKGCFMGQELTARMKYRGLAKKRLVPVRIEGPTPEPGTQVQRGKKVAGTVRSAVDGIGLAQLKLDQIDAGEDAEPLLAGESTLTPQKPAWANF